VATPADVAEAAEAVWMVVADPTQYLNGNIIDVSGGSHLA
jgi:hypothetical protein